MKSVRLLIAIMLCAFSYSIVAAQNAPRGITNQGTDFWFSLPLNWPQFGGGGGIKIYVSSDTVVQCTLEISAFGKIVTKNTIANGIIIFELTPAEAQVYEKSDKPGTAKTEEETWLEGKGRGIHISAPVPITVYGLSYFQYTTDSFLAIPTSALGKEYIVASYADFTSNQTTYGYFPSQTVITAAYDNTSVSFTLGGSSGTQTVGGMNRGETKTFLMNKGDVIAFANKKAKSGYSDISGSTIIASRPVAVVSGNQGAFVDVTTGFSDYLAEMELPTSTWGTQYHVTPIFGRKKYSFIKIFAKNPNTKVYRDGSTTPFTVLTTSGGNNSTGYYEGRLITDGTSPRPVTISADGPISVTQYNPGQADDNAGPDPFQIVLTPAEQYQREMTFHALEIPGVPGKADYLNLVFEANSDGTIPADLEFGTPENESYSWKSIKLLSGGTPQLISGSNYYFKSIPISNTTVFKVRSSKGVAGYIYSTAEPASIGNPASLGLRDLSKAGGDILAPNLTYTQQCDGSISNGKATDRASDVLSRANLAIMQLLKGSRNYTFEKENFIPGESSSATWKLTVNDPAQSAIAYIYVCDRAGNDTTITIRHSPLSLKISTNKIDLGLVKTGESKEVSFTLDNTSAETSYVIKKLSLPASEQRFTFKNPPQLPLVLAPQEKKKIDIIFTADLDSSFKTSVAIEADDGCTKLAAEILAHSGTPLILANDVDFGITRPGIPVEKEITIRNNGTAELTITQISDPSSTEFTLQNMNDISEANPLVIPFEKGKNEKKIIVRFLPQSKGNFLGEMHFTSDTRIPESDKITILSGRAEEPTSTDITEMATFTISPNPATGIATITLPPFKSQNVFLKLFDALGNEVTDFSNDLLKTELRFDTKALPNGAYFLRFTDGKTTLSRSFIIQN